MERITILFSFTFQVDTDRLLIFFNWTLVEGDMLLPRVWIPRASICPVLSKSTTSSFVFHNSQLTPTIEVILSILELSYGELLLAHFPNLEASNFHR
jgi:hypothetical protein